MYVSVVIWMAPLKILTNKATTRNESEALITNNHDHIQNAQLEAQIQGQEWLVSKPEKLQTNDNYYKNYSYKQPQLCE